VSSYQRGRRAEALAAWFLRLKGFSVLERRWSCPVGEIDLIARRGRLLLFVEVKARLDRVAALEALGARQRRRISRAAGAYLQRFPQLAQLDCRFDLIALRPWAWPDHVADAWRD